MKTKFYEVSQNNSGGSFVVNDKVCHRLFIEASSEEESLSIAEDLGCYWNGVSEGMDCECCGDRWYGSDEIDFDKINNKWNGYEYAAYLSSYNESVENLIDKIKSNFPDARWAEELKVENKYGSNRVVGRMFIDNIEQYAQLMADLYGWTTPDCRIFYKNGEVKEIFSNKLK